MSVRRGESARLESAASAVTVDSPGRRFAERLPGLAGSGLPPHGVVGMSRGHRAPDREVRRREPRRQGPGHQPRPRQLAGGDHLLRHLPEAAVEGLLVYGSQRAAQQAGALWTGSLVSALTVGALCWRPARRRLLALAGCLLTRARLRPAVAQRQRPRRTGRSPGVLATLPAGLGERVWLLYPVRVSVDGIAGENDRLRAACVAREVRGAPGRLATVVALDVTRRSRPASAAAGCPSRGAAPPGIGAGRGTVVPARSLAVGIGAGAGRCRL
jgi:hypothetical protein